MKYEFKMRLDGYSILQKPAAVDEKNIPLLGKHEQYAYITMYPKWPLCTGAIFIVIKFLLSEMEKFRHFPPKYTQVIIWFPGGGGVS